MAISVRDHLPGERAEGVSLRELREIEEERSGEDIGPSVRGLLDELSCSTLRLGEVRLTRGDSSVLEELEGDTSPMRFSSSVVLRLHESGIELAVGETDLVPPRDTG